MKKQVSIKTDKSILVREIYRLKRELVAETHRADENLRLLRAGRLADDAAERDCTIEGMGCGHVPGDDECNGCGNWQLVEHDELV